MTNLRTLGAAAVLIGASALPVAAAEPAPAPPTDVSGSGGTLSDKLSDTNGVIHPQGTVDPSMEKSAPQTGRMPVIPPAGSPGNAPDVQPK